LPILPIDTGRYGSEEMRRIFDYENRIQRMLDVEAALALSQAELGEIPRKDAKIIAGRAKTKYVTPARVQQFEARTRHETMAVVEALAQVCGPSGGFVHLGATSSDILDTASALQLKDAYTLLLERLGRLEAVLLKLTRRYAGTIMVGRTHGQHTHPITLGLKVAVWMREISRHTARLTSTRQRVLVGKLSGAVGTMAAFGPHAVQLQQRVLTRLGLEVPEVTTQIVQRDRHAEFVANLAMLASTLDKFTTEIRNLQRSEIGEVMEPFDAKAQVGSSTMPHKMNPSSSENISSLAKIVRSLVPPSLESIVTWHERDLTQSASERFILPEACILVEHMLSSMIRILDGLKVNAKRMRENLMMDGGLSMSESVMMALTRRGVGRQEAHRLVREIALKVVHADSSFQAMLEKDRRITKRLSPKDIKNALDPRNYLGKTNELIRLAIQKTERERRERSR
jgi:adenylosuccinate lyase